MPGLSRALHKQQPLLILLLLLLLSLYSDKLQIFPLWCDNIFPLWLCPIVGNLWLTVVHLLLSIPLFLFFFIPPPPMALHYTGLTSIYPHSLPSFINHSAFWVKEWNCWKAKGFEHLYRKRWNDVDKSFQLIQILEHITSELQGCLGQDWVTSLSLFTFMNWRRQWQPTPVILPGECKGRGSLVGCCLWGHTESDTTEAT